MSYVLMPVLVGRDSVPGDCGVSSSVTVNLEISIDDFARAFVEGNRAWRDVHASRPSGPAGAAAFHTSSQE